MSGIVLNTLKHHYINFRVLMQGIIVPIVWGRETEA